MLKWLKNKNFLYNDIFINFDFMITWERVFGLVGISNSILWCDKDIQERKGYAEADNIRNNLYYTFNNAKRDNSGLLSKSLYIKVNNT